MKMFKAWEKEKVIKIFFKALLLMVGLLISILVYSLIFQQKLISIDKYNFEQLKKVDQIISNDKEYNILFHDIDEFNYVYNSDIKPIKNCYYIAKSNGDEKYLFGFKLESIIYKLRYFSRYYAYPKYDLPIGGFWGSTENINLNGFKNVIFNPCKEKFNNH